MKLHMDHWIMDHHTARFSITKLQVLLQYNTGVNVAAGILHVETSPYHCKNKKTCDHRFDQQNRHLGSEH